MRSLVRNARVGHLATVGADGLPHVVPICFALIEATAYSAVDHKPKRHPRLRRIANIEATGHATLLVDHYDEDWSALWWVRLDGSARVVVHELNEAGDALAALAAKYEQYAQSPPTGPVIALDVASWSGWSGS